MDLIVKYLFKNTEAAFNGSLFFSKKILITNFTVIPIYPKYFHQFVQKRLTNTKNFSSIKLFVTLNKLKIYEAE